MDDLGINVNDSVKTQDKFGKGNSKTKEELQRELAKGLALTVQLTDLAQADNIVNFAWDISKKTGKIALIVVKAT